MTSLLKDRVSLWILEYTLDIFFFFFHNRRMKFPKIIVIKFSDFWTKLLTSFGPLPYITTFCGLFDLPPVFSINKRWFIATAKDINTILLMYKQKKKNTKYKQKNKTQTVLLFFKKVFSMKKCKQLKVGNLFIQNLFHLFLHYKTLILYKNINTKVSKIFMIFIN